MSTVPRWRDPAVDESQLRFVTGIWGPNATGSLAGHVFIQNTCINTFCGKEIMRRVGKGETETSMAQPQAAKPPPRLSPDRQPQSTGRGGGDVCSQPNRGEPRARKGRLRPCSVLSLCDLLPLLSVRCAGTERSVAFKGWALFEARISAHN